MEAPKDVPPGYTQVMLDLETLGQAPGCVVLSVGLCALSQEGQRVSDPWEAKLKVEEQVVRYGLTKDPDTLAWWDKQGDEARAVLEPSAQDLTVLEMGAAVAAKLRAWGLPAGAKVWANGADFDLPILQALYQRARIGWPWKFYHHRCFRTVKNLFAAVEKPEFRGVRHSAGGDAHHQALHLAAIIQANRGLPW